MRVGSIVIHCHEFDRMVAFWQQALRYVPRERTTAKEPKLDAPRPLCQQQRCGGRADSLAGGDPLSLAISSSRRLCCAAGSRRESLLRCSKARYGIGVEHWWPPPREPVP